MNHANQGNRRSPRTSNRSSSVTQNDSAQQPTTSSNTNRPMTRSFAKQQQQQQNQTPALHSSQSSLSSSNSSLNSMDQSTPSLNQNEPKLNSFISTQANFFTQMNQIKFKFGKNLQENQFKEEEISYQKILVNEKPINIINLIEKSKLSGRMFSNISSLPNPALAFVTQRLKSHDYPLLIKRLDQSSVTFNLKKGTPEVDDLIQILRDIENRLVNYNPNASDPDSPNDDESQMREEFEVETINVESAMMFRQFGGVEIFKRILLLSILVTDHVIDSNDKSLNTGFEKWFILKIKCKVIHILNRLICLPLFGKLLVYDLLQYKPCAQKTNIDYDTTLLQYLFSLLMFKESRLQACQLIESILLHIPMLSLNRIQNLKLILETIDDDGLSCICKIFAVTLSNLDMVDKKYLSSSGRRVVHQQPHNPAQANPTALTPALSIRDQNQEFLLNIPSLLLRLVILVRHKDYTVRFSGANNEIEHWIRYIDEALSDSDDNETDSMDTTSSNLNNLENQLNQPALLAAAKLNNFVYVLYTLSLLLIGKEKKRVQKTLTKLRLASALNSLFDYLIWNCRCEYPGSSNGQDQQLQQQMRSHICPEVAVKIQFLRLVHSFCDHSEFKRVILSKDETDEILNYNREAHECLKINDSVLKIENRVRCTKESEGLLSKIVQVIKKEPFSASFRFWLIRAIESYLRGGTSYAEQLFLINRGIVEDTVQNILAVNFTRPKEVIQSCFDMLGELVKFNTKGFEILNSKLVDTENFNLLLTMINQSLIDSNMFLRSIFLSIDFIELNLSALNYKISSNRILTYFDSFDRRILFLSRMMNIINIHNLSQENISCLNTTLIVLMLANRRNTLPKYLRAIKLKSIEMLLASDFIHVNRDETRASSQAQGSSGSQPVDLISNFKDLLVFWQTHYLQKDKDCAGLEQNSKIEFSYWKKTVELLLDSNHKNECSLNFYLQNDYMNMNNSRKSSIDDYRSD